LKLARRVVAELRAAGWRLERAFSPITVRALLDQLPLDVEHTSGRAKSSP
jgi:hypothetical protein